MKFNRLQEAGLLVVFLILGIALSLLAPQVRGENGFLRPANLIPSVFTTMSWYAIMAVGVAVVIIGGGIDISVGSIKGLAALGTAAVLQQFPEDASAWKVVSLGIGVPLAIGLLCGLVNGGLVVFLRMHPFIVTLGTLSIFRGIAIISVREGSLPTGEKILPGAFTIIGSSLDEAKEKRARLDSLVSYESGIAALSIATGVDARKFDPDGPLPEIPETNQSKSGRERVVALARRENLTVRQIAGRLGGYGGLAMMGTPKMIADQMQEWLETNASDGFNVMFPYLPGGLDDFVNLVVPELQRRGLFRTEYEGKTLRENLGLPRPENKFFAATANAAEQQTTSS